MTLRRLALPVVIAGSSFLASPGVMACAVCFGRTDSPLGKGLHWGVLALLGFVFVTLAAFGAFAVFLVRRSMAAEAADELAAEMDADPSSRETASTSASDPKIH